jgi:hypothetical protein
MMEVTSECEELWHLHLRQLFFLGYLTVLFKIHYTTCVVHLIKYVSLDPKEKKESKANLAGQGTKEKRGLPGYQVDKEKQERLGPEGSKE